MIFKKNQQYREMPKGSPVLHFLYTNPVGRLLLKAFIRREVSQKARSIFCSPLSAVAIAPFIKKSKIDMSQYQKGPFHSFNDFFIRQILLFISQERVLWMQNSDRK